MREQHNARSARRNDQTAFQFDRVRSDADDLFALLNGFIVALLLAAVGISSGYETQVGFQRFWSGSRSFLI
ncbi:MAG TPA: hypothetical protein VJN43_23990 [Bryobacteraceae bacterium]|nr:hypothetical protein [Bryobacteraceae bacterium]